MTPLARGVRERRLDRRLVEVDAEDRLEAEPRRGDREDAGAAADVEQEARLQGLSSSSVSRVVGCAPVPKARPGSMTIGSAPAPLPRRADPEAADLDAVVELAPARPPSRPAMSVVVDDIEPERRLVGVDREGAVELLDALGEDVEEEHELRLPSDNDVPLQRNALFSFSKKPSSAL